MKSTLALTKLEAFARALLSVLLALLAAGIAGEKAFRLQFLAQFYVELEQRAGNAHPESSGLAIQAASGNAGHHIKSRGGFTGDQRLAHLNTLRVRGKILFESSPVHLKLAAARTQEDPGYARFAASRTVILNCFSHLLIIHSVKESSLTAAALPGLLKPRPEPQAFVLHGRACHPCKLSASCPCCGQAWSWATYPEWHPAPPGQDGDQSACGTPLRASRRETRCSGDRPSARSLRRSHGSSPH